MKWLTYRISFTVPIDPAQTQLVPDSSSHFIDTRLYLESQWRQQTPTDAQLHIGHRAVMDPLRYQLEPASRALQQPRQHILIADTVGLGKTLEAGILMSGKRLIIGRLPPRPLV